MQVPGATLPSPTDIFFALAGVVPWRTIPSDTSAALTCVCSPHQLLVQLVTTLADAFLDASWKIRLPGRPEFQPQLQALVCGPPPCGPTYAFRPLSTTTQWHGSPSKTANLLLRTTQGV
jgi:hypothetical protein